MKLDKTLDLVMPPGSPPMTRADFELRLGNVLYPVRQRNRETFIDPTMVVGTVHSLAYGFGAIRFTAADGKSGAIGHATDLIHLTGRNDGPAERFDSTSPNRQGTCVVLIDEDGHEKRTRQGAETEAEIARIKLVRENRRIEKLRQDLVAAGQL